MDYLNPPINEIALNESIKLFLQSVSDINDVNSALTILASKDVENQKLVLPLQHDRQLFPLKQITPIEDKLKFNSIHISNGYKELP